MKARVTITGNLTADPVNFINKNNQRQCRFSVAVNLTKEKGFYIDCFLNRYLSPQELKYYRKGILCTFTGKYSESVRVDMEDQAYLSRTLTITAFYGSKTKSPFYKDFALHLVGYIFSQPQVSDKKTVFMIADSKILHSEAKQPSLYTCTLNYKLSETVINQMVENTSIYVQGLYNEEISVTPVTNDIYIHRHIEVKDYEFIL